jgi:hypothetical protein
VLNAAARPRGRALAGRDEDKGLKWRAASGDQLLGLLMHLSGSVVQGLAQSNSASGALHSHPPTLHKSSGRAHGGRAAISKPVFDSFLPRPSKTQADDVVGLFVYTLGDGARSVSKACKKRSRRARCLARGP